MNRVLVKHLKRIADHVLSHFNNLKVTRGAFTRPISEADFAFS